MKFGYARVSTHDQNLDLQIDALRKKGCEKIFHETVSGAKADRIELKKLLGEVRKGDVIMIWKLDRLALLRTFLLLQMSLWKKGLILKALTTP